MCLHEGMPESAAVFGVEAAGQVYNQTDEFVYLRGNVNHNNADMCIEVDRRKLRMLKSRYMRQCCTAASRGAGARATTTRCTASPP